MEEEAEHHSQISSQSTMSNEINLSSTVPPKNNNTVYIEQQPRPHVVEQAQNNNLSSNEAREKWFNEMRGLWLHVVEQAHNNKLSPKEAREKWFNEMRGWIMVVAVLVASVTYTTGLNPPGGFWQDDNGNHEAGSPILRDKSIERYTTFFYANATAFMTSLVIIILLMSQKFYCDTSKVILLYFSMVIDLNSLMIAYAAGCGRSLSTSIYVIVLAAVVLIVLSTSTYVFRILLVLGKDVAGHDLIPGQSCSIAEMRDCDTNQDRVSDR